MNKSGIKLDSKWRSLMETNWGQISQVRNQVRTQVEDITEVIKEEEST